MTAALRKARIAKFGSIEEFEKSYICKECKKKKEVVEKFEANEDAEGKEMGSDLKITEVNSKKTTLKEARDEEVKEGEEF